MDVKENTMDTDSYIHSLLVANSLREPSLREAVEMLQLPPGSRGLDAGCGIGLQCLLLAEAVGLTGHVTGLDVSTEFLNRGQEMMKEGWSVGTDIISERGYWQYSL